MLKLLLLLAGVVCSQAMFQCPPDYCDTLTCQDVSDCNGEVRQNGGWCGCCDACITMIGEGESCASMLLLGVPATHDCAPGLQCDRSTWTCQQTSKLTVHKRAVGTCAARLAEIQRSRENGLPLIGVSDPKCDGNGDFAAVQCEGSICFCVDTDGSQLESYKVSIGELANMNCQCARDKAAYMRTGLIGKLFICDQYGNYANTQAPQPTTTAAPPTTKPLGGSGTLLTGSGTGTSGQTFFGSPYATNGACYKALQTAQGSSLLGTFVPECDADGNYAPRQCQGSECYCVRKDGTKIAGYSAPIASKYQVTCQCARDKDLAAAGQLFGGQIHTCRANGNYQQYQCIGSVCYCTDDAGNRLESQSIGIGNVNQLKCP